VDQALVRPPVCDHRDEVDVPVEEDEHGPAQRTDAASPAVGRKQALPGPGGVQEVVANLGVELAGDHLGRVPPRAPNVRHLSGGDDDGEETGRDSVDLGFDRGFCRGWGVEDTVGSAVGREGIGGGQSSGCRGSGGGSGRQGSRWEKRKELRGRSYEGEILIEYLVIFVGRWA